LFSTCLSFCLYAVFLYVCSFSLDVFLHVCIFVSLSLSLYIYFLFCFSFYYFALALFVQLNSCCSIS
jgi:hypothetical protein